MEDDHADPFDWSAFRALGLEEEIHPYTMASLLMDEKDHCDADKIKTRGIDDEEKKHPHRMACFLTNTNDADPTGAHEFSVPEYHPSHHPRDRIEAEHLSGSHPGANCCEIRYASEGNSYMDWLKSQRRGEELDEFRYKGHSREEEHHHSKTHGHKEDHHNYKVHPSPRADNKHFSLEVLIKLSYDCYMNGKKVEEQMTLEVFEDQDFKKFSGMLGRGWLPAIPISFKKVYRKYTKETFFRETFVLVKYFYYALEQLKKDQVTFRGAYYKHFRQLFQDCTRLSLEYDASIKALKITGVVGNVTSGSMPNEYKNLKTVLGRTLRDYMVLLHYIKAVSFISRGFCYMRYEFY